MVRKPSDFPCNTQTETPHKGKANRPNKIAKGIQRIKIDRSEVKRREGPPFPANPWYKISNFYHKILTLGEKREEQKDQGGGDGKSSALLFLREGKEKKLGEQERKRSRTPGRGGARLFLRQGKEKNREGGKERG